MATSLDADMNFVPAPERLVKWILIFTGWSDTIVASGNDQGWNVNTFGSL
jgi:hypothetical protein